MILCRDCAHLVASWQDRCPVCRSPRLLAHDGLISLTVAHLDCDAFYASIEKRDNPQLLSRPVVVGGGQRGVVSSACYIARSYGVRSAMPIYRALNLCPDAVILRPNMEKYKAASRQIHRLMQTLTPCMEPLALDEAFLDFSSGPLPGPAAIHLAQLARKIEIEVGVTVSIGLSYNKLLAKIASNLDKPRGFAVIGRDEATEFLANQPVSLLWGVGAALKQRLARDGIHTIGQLATLSEITLARRYGRIGRSLHAFARGKDQRQVTPARPVKSVSAEITFLEDTANLADLERALRRLSEKVAHRLLAASKLGGCVILKLKTADFTQRTRSSTPPIPISAQESLWQIASNLLQREVDGTHFRLIGLGCDRLSERNAAAPNLLGSTPWQQDRL